MFSNKIEYAQMIDPRRMQATRKSHTNLNAFTNYMPVQTQLVAPHVVNIKAKENAETGAAFGVQTN
mgnify:CR=1 FL=1